MNSENISHGLWTGLLRTMTIIAAITMRPTRTIRYDKMD